MRAPLRPRDIPYWYMDPFGKDERPHTPKCRARGFGFAAQASWPPGKGGTCSGPVHLGHMAVSINWGSCFGVLISGIQLFLGPHWLPLIFGNSHIDSNTGRKSFKHAESRRSQCANEMNNNTMACKKAYPKGLVLVWYILGPLRGSCIPT